MPPIELTVEESLAFMAAQAEWDGFAAGAQAAAEQGKRMALRKIMDARKAAPTEPASEPATPEEIMPPTG